MEYFIDTRVASIIYGVGERALRAAVERGSDAYRHTYIEAKGRGGKKLLIGVTKTQLEKADLDPEALIWNDVLEPTTFEMFKSTLISDEKKENIAPDMRDFLNASETQQRQTLLKLNVIEGYAHRKGSTSEYIASLGSKFDELGITEGKLFRWLKSYADAKESGISPLVALLDKRGAERGATKLSAEQKEMAVRLLCRRDNPLRVSAIYRNMKHRFGTAMPSYAVLNNFLKRWKRENASLYEFAQNADKWKNSRLSAQGSLSEKALYPNHYWELDSTPADIITGDGKRYTILGAIDVFSRRRVFWVDERSSSFSIARLLRRAIMKLGIPEHVVIDNGKDYQSNHFESICYNLGIDMVTVPPFSGDMKPHIERVFRSLSSQLFEEMEGYIGHSVAERSAIESRRGFAHKIESQEKWYKKAREAKKGAFVDGFKIKEGNLGLELKMAVEADELMRWIDGWTDMVEREKHSSLPGTPLQQWQKQVVPVKAVPDERMLDILFGESFTRKVGKKGISLHGALYQHVQLAYHVGEDVRVMSVDEMGHVYVYTMNLEPICIAEDYDFIGQSREKLAEAKRISHRIAREHARMLEAWERVSREIDPSIKDRIVASMAERGVEMPMSTPAVTKPTEVILNIMEASKTFAAQDAEAAADSNITDMQGEKLLPSGRPPFRQVYDRFMWDLEHDMVDDSTKELKIGREEIWNAAEREYERKKAG